MRYDIFVAAVAILLAAAVPAGAEQRKFEILGGLGDGESSEILPRDAMPFAVASRRVVEFQTNLPRGTVIVKTGERRLYYVMHDGRAIMYSVGVGREGFTWSGKAAVSRKSEWPDWRPPREMIEREAEYGVRIPKFLAGGPDNPLGARAIYIGDTEYRIHGTSQPWSIGQAVSSGCIRMTNEEVIDLYKRVDIGTLVVVE